MYEFNNKEWSVEDIQATADRQGLSYDEVFNQLTKAGMVEKEAYDKKKIDSEESSIQQLSNFVTNWWDNVPEKVDQMAASGRQLLVQSLIDADMKALSDVFAGEEGDAQKRGKQFIVDPRTGDKVYVDTSSEDSLAKIKELRQFSLDNNIELEARYDNGQAVGEVAIEKSEELLKELDKIEEEMMQTGDFMEGVKAMSAGNLKDGVPNVIGGSLGFIGSMAETVGPALFTKGLSIIPQIGLPMYTSYNRDRADALYGEENPDKYRLLAENGESGYIVPATMTGVSYALEKIGLKGVTQEMLRKHLAKKGARNIALMMNANIGEAATEWGQFGTETLNSSLAKGKSIDEALLEAGESLFTEDALESAIGGFVGSQSMISGSRGARKARIALRNESTTAKEIDQMFSTLETLRDKSFQAKTREQKEVYQNKIELVEESLRDYFSEIKSVADVLSSSQVSELESLYNKKVQNNNKVKKLKQQLDKGLISRLEFDEAAQAFLESNSSIDTSIDNIKKEAKESVFQKNIKFSKENAGKTGQKYKLVKTIEEAQKLLNEIVEDLNKNKKEEDKISLPKLTEEDDGFNLGGFQVTIEENARRKGRISTGSHELLHGVTQNYFNSLETGEKKKLVTSFWNILTKEQKEVIGQRLSGVYGADKTDVLSNIDDWIDKGDEMFTSFSDAIAQNEISYDEGTFSKILNYIQELLRKSGYVKEFTNGRQVYNFLRDYNNSIYKGNLSERSQKFLEENKDLQSPEEASFSKTRKTVLEEINSLLPENIKTKEDYNKFLDDPRSFMELYKATQDDGVISNYVKSRTTNKAEFAEAIDSVIMRLRNFNPSKKRKEGGVVGRDGFGEFVFANTNFSKKIAKKALAIKAEEAKQTKSIDAEESFTQIADESTAFDEDVTPTKEKAKKPKINILKFAGLDKVVGKIRDLVKPVKGDTFKEIISKYAGDVGQLIFDIPAKKIMEGGANLIPTTKIKEGMAIPSEALNIQRFFGSSQNLDKFIRTLPLYNVTTKTADINKAGENIDVSRDTYGVAIGLKGLPLNYFYENFTDPKATSKDPKTKSKAETSPGGRSLGLSSQTPVKRLKAEFRNPMPETIEKVRADIGITPTTQKNNYNRDIGQLLKGFAKVYSINAALSAAQRAQEAKLETAKPEDVKAIKQQVADITAAQSKIAFSKSGKIIASDEMMKVMFSKSQGKRAAEAFGYDHLDLNKEEAKEDLIDWVKNVGSKVMPRSFWEANGNLIGSGAKYKTLTIDGQEVKQYLLKDGSTILETDPDFSSYELNLMPAGKMVFANKAQMNEAFKDVKFAPENKNVKDSTKRITLYGKKTGEQVKKLIDKKKDFLNNSDKGFVDTWMAIVKDIDQNPNNRRFWAAWLEVTPQNMSHFMRVGAKLSFYNTLDLKNVEEHTSPATDFAFALWAFANSRDKKGNQILTEALLKKSMESYIQGSLPKIFDNLLKGDGFDYIATIPKEYRLQVIAGEIPVWIRYINDKVNAQKYTLDGVEYSGVNPNVIMLANGKTLAQNYGLGIDKRLHFYQGAISTQQDLLFKVFKGEITEANAKKQLDKYVEGTKILKLNTKAKAKMSKAITNVRPVLAYSKTSRGMSTFDFDETLIIDGENFVVATKDGETVKIPSDKWPIDGPRYAAEGYNFDFSDFVNVRGGKEGPLLQKMKNQIKKYGTSNVFVLTARMQDAAEPIHEWLKSKGINIPLENITGLGKSEGDAKAQWFVDKYAEGYNDMYFVDDALPNVEAVKHVFDQLDIKGKSVQARIQFSKGLDPMFNKMLERTKGVGAEKVFSRVVAKKRGKNVGRFQFFVPPSADDFAGLLRYFVGKGEQGNADIEFFNEALIKPFARADREMSMLRQAILGDYKKLRKEYKDVKKKLGKMMPNSEFTLDNAIRVYLWNKAGFEIPGLSKRDTENLVARVEADTVTKAFADALGLISRQEKGYSKPGENWNTETIAYDLQNIATKVSRKKFMAEWIENKDEIFTPENLNKIEAVYGTDFREALKDILYRMENGTNRSSNKSYGQGWTNWVNGSVGAIMFFNSRSAVLQTLSMVNFINFEDNNIFKAGKAFANQKQYWSDFSTLFNSDFLKNRRAGLATNVNEAELANAVAGATNKSKAAIAYLLKIGFTPTQMADSFAIASGGATFYRNRVDKYMKEGRSKRKAEDQAFLDFQEIAEETQQSARPDRISQQQASPLGRLILAFANTPMQYNRLIKKAAGDIINNRGDIKANISRILYYGAIQNAIFASLQNAVFALAFDDEEDEEMLDKKSERVLNSMLDSLLRGSGVAGAAVSTIKNVILEFMAQSERGYKADYGEVMVEALNVSPPIGSKARKLYSAQKTYKFNRDAMGEMDTFDYNNPIWDATGSLTSAAFNLPLDRAIRKIDNMREAFNQENSAMQRTFLALGWSAWDLNVGEEMIMNKGKSNEYIKLMPLKQKAQYEAEKKMDAREKEEKKANQQQCTKIKSNNRRCKIMVDKPKKRCHFHD